MRVVFMGTPAFAVASLRALLTGPFEVAGVVSPPDRPAGRGRMPVSPAVAQAARAAGLPLIQPIDPHEPAAREALARWSPDVFVVAAYGVILRSALLDMPPAGAVNVHASLLPRHRGACPIHRAIQAGDEMAGVTIMRMAAGMDTGPILSQRALPIADDDTTGTLSDKLAQLGATLLVETLPAYLRGEITPRPQEENEATHTGMLSKAEGEIDWTAPAVAIWRTVRAFQPWPGTFTCWNGTLLKIIEAWPTQDAEHYGEPGEVVEIEGEPAVATGTGALWLKQVQLAGKKPLDGITFARGRRGFVGSRLE